MTAWWRWAWRQLTSMRTALVLLFLLALASVPGSVLPQRGLTPEKVAQYYQDNPALAEFLDRLSLFDVFGAPWFAAIYILLFVSLAGCVLPRSLQHWQDIRRRPPTAPRNLSRLPHHDSFTTTSSDPLAEVATTLKARRFRVSTGEDWVAAEKGYLHETGNLLFHLALLVLLCAVGAGSVYGYRGAVLIVEGDGFANTVASYDRFEPGRSVTPGSLQPFSFRLTDFSASYIDAGPKRGQAREFRAKLVVRDSPSSRERPYDLVPNGPLQVDGVQVYLLGHGYAPVFRVTDGKGQVAFEGSVPFLVLVKQTLSSEGVIKVPDAHPDQLGFIGTFVPTDGSDFPAADKPAVRLTGYKGKLGLDSGVPQSVYDLPSRTTMSKLQMPERPLTIGETLTLPDGAGSITFTGLKEWATVQITYDPGRMLAVASGGVAVVALTLSLFVRRRRVWVRLRDGGVDVGGLTRTEGGFEDEFAEIVAAVRKE